MSAPSCTHASTHLQKLVDCLRDAFAVDCGVWQVHKNLGRLRLRRLELLALALLGHFRRSLAVSGVDLVPLLHPHVSWFGCINHLLSGNVLFLARRKEFKQVDPLLCIKLDSQGAARHKLSKLLVNV